MPPIVTTKDVALKLHDLGYPIVPCKGKVPTVKGWGEERLTREQLSAALENPKLNIAIVLNLSPLVDVECDSHEAEESLLSMFDGEIPPTPTYKSKRGRHRLFRRPNGLPQKAVIKLAEVEFRIGNGKPALSVIPPSVHPDGPQYKWEKGLSIHQVEPAELPASIVERLCGSGPPPPAAEDGDIPEGERNDTLFKMACQLFRSKLDNEDVVFTLHVINAKRCKPPLPNDEIEGILNSAYALCAKDPQTYAQILMGLARAACELWHTANGTAFATVRRDGHQEHYKVRSSDCRQWLTREFYESEQVAIGDQTLQNVLNTLEAQAKFKGEEHPVFLRVAEHEGRIYLDLCDDSWGAVEVDEDGWRIVDKPPVRFRRTKGMLPLPIPEQGGTVDELRPFVNVTDDGWVLVLAWVVTSLRLFPAYPILKLIGEQGSAKTTLAEVMRALVDPHECPLRRPPTTERDLMIAANNSWLVSFDNLSFLPSDLSDALCSLSTCGGFATRTLYTDDEETIFRAVRPILLNGIEGVAPRSDLMDRCVMVELPRIEGQCRKAKAEFWTAFTAARPRILGALLNVVAGALQRLPQARQACKEWPRMADFAQWATAAEPALGLKPGTFRTAYQRSLDAVNQAALESSPIIPQLYQVLEGRDGKFVGTATKLLNLFSLGQDTRVRGWPRSANHLSGMLQRLAPNLRQAGLKIEKVRKGNDKYWVIEDQRPRTQRTQCTQKNDQIPQPGPGADPKGMSPLAQQLDKVYSNDEE
jgi:hypothetical protein